ncbi:MAG TPA: hypothetical protein VF267_00235 [Gammaproteobacteria bacterium]
MKRILLLPMLCALAGCGMGTLSEKSIHGMLGAIVPDQYEQFSRAYAEHVLATDIEAAEAMVPAENYCIVDLRDAEFRLGVAAEREANCSPDPAGLREILRHVPAGNANAVHVVGYHFNARPGRIDIGIEQEFVYENIIARVAMDYERNGDMQRVTKTTVTLDDMTQFGRIRVMLDAPPFNVFMWLIWLQVAAYLAVPLIVLWVLKRQRTRDAGRDNEGRFTA